MIFQKPRRAIKRVFLHCSASDAPELAGDRLVSEITAWHRKNGWDTIGYHFIIDKAGRVMPGRPLEVNPAAQKGHNIRTIAICVHGLAIENFTDAALSACLDLCDQINRAYAGAVTFHGHREVAPKLCPVFDYRELLQLDRDGRMPLQLTKAPQKGSAP